MSIAAGQIQSREGIPFIRMIIVLLLAALLVAGINFFLLLRKNDEDRRAIELTTEMQVLSQQIAKAATDAITGDEASFADLKTNQAKIQQNLVALQKGDDSRGIAEPDPSIQDELKKLADIWTPIDTASKSILSNQQLVVDINKTREEFAAKIPILGAKMDDVVNIMVASNAPASQIYVSSRQLVLADRMLRRVNEIVQGGEAAVTAADGFGRDAAIFGRVLTGLTNGNAELGIRAVDSPRGQQLLAEVFKLFEEIGKDVDKILQASTDLFEVKANSETVFQDSTDLLNNSALLARGINALPAERWWPSRLIGGIASAIALALLVVLLILFLNDQRKRYQATADLNQRNQEAILRLLDEMGSLAEGDLTVRATVTEDITGAIADSINFAVEALRSLVTTINETAVQVAAAAQETQATAMHLAEASEHQAQQITSASAAINEIAVSIDEVSRNSAESADVAQRSVQLASKGAEVVRQTIKGMDNIREQIQETSKRIKRLGESSQEIGDIVELINDIAEQTNILALNAAIQAASAGEAGRGFAVVADEVQRLAERASNATKRIETLVQTIQADTNEAVISMEQTTAEVVNGARRAEDAGLALGEIEKVSNDLADLIQNISEAARQQSAAATNISGTMNVIQEITTQTSAGTSQTAESIGILADLARDLRKSVADFKLPT
jgi:twitching motility protein PilJ